MGSGKVVGVPMGRIYLDIRPRDLRMVALLVIFRISLFLQAAPVKLRPNWRVTSILSQSSITAPSPCVS